MTRRQSIAKAIADQLNKINGDPEWDGVSLYGNATVGMKFIDEVTDSPFVCVTPGPEVREYLPSNFKWRFLDIKVFVYILRSEDPEDELERVLGAIETQLDQLDTLQYVENTATSGNQIVDIRISSITTDQGAFASDGMAVGEVTVNIRH